MSEDKLNLRSKWALVTGATSGFGEAIARKFAEDGFHLIITGRRSDRLKTLQAELSSHVQVETRAFDIQNLDACRAAVQDLVHPIDVLVNNAGLALGTTHFDCAEISDWEAMIDTNIKGLLYMTRLLLPTMRTRNVGHIINIGSVAGRWTYEGGSVYSATKFAVRAISEGLRHDLVGTQIRVTNIEPGMGDTEFSLVRFNQDQKKANQVYEGMTPLHAIDIAEAASWCASRPAHVNVQELVIFPTDQAAIRTISRQKL